MKKLIKIGRYKNKSNDTQYMVEKWACMNPSIKDGDQFVAKTILINLEKMNRCIFYPIKKDLVFIDCAFFGSRKNLKGDLLKEFDLMIYRDDIGIVL